MVPPRSPRDQMKSLTQPEQQDPKGSSSRKVGTFADSDQRDENDNVGSKTGATSEPSGAGVGRPCKEVRKKEGDKPVSFEKVMGRLPIIKSREEVDLFVQYFSVSVESYRNGTKRLAKALYVVFAQKLNLLPAYARISASLRPEYPDVPATVAASLVDDFKLLEAKTDIDEKNLVTGIKTAHYIGEYVKFGFLGIQTMFELLTLCMQDFSGHRVDVACHLLESCSRYVYLSPSSHFRMTNILETVCRLKSVKNLEARHNNALVETAYFAVRLSPGSKAHKKKTRPPIHEYIRHLMYYLLDSSNIRWIHNQFLKLPWDNDLEHYVIKKFVKISRARYSTLKCSSSHLRL